MKLCITLLFLTLCSAVYNQEIGDTELFFSPDTTHQSLWKNTVKFERGQDYIKTLDMDFLKGDTSNHEYRQLLEDFWTLTLPYGKEIYLLIAERSRQVKEDNMAGLYKALLKELLTNGHDEALALEFYPDLFPVHRQALASVKNQNQAYLNHGRVPIKMNFSNFGQPVVEILINGQATMAMFDTGAEFSVINNKVAENLGIQVFRNFPFEVGTINSLGVKGYFGIIDSITIGHVVLKRHPVLVFPEENMRFGNDTLFYKTDFIFGWPGIARIDCTLDGPNGHYMAHLPRYRNVPYHNFFWMGFAALKASALNGQSLLFGLDTGADDSELKKGILLKFPRLETRTTTIGIGGAGGIEKFEMPVVRSFDFYLAGQKIIGKELMLRENIDLFFLRQDGTIGAEMFKEHTVRLDYFNRHLSVEK